MRNQNKNFKRNGQIMLVSIMVLGGIIIGSTAIAGFIFLLQRQQVVDSADSARALAAADTGMEHINFLIYKEKSLDCQETTEITGDKMSFAFPSAGETRYEARCGATSLQLTITSEGYSRDVTRILQTIMTE